MSFVTLFTGAACDRRARNVSLVSDVILLASELLMVMATKPVVSLLLFPLDQGV
jgi:hypothetical protein